MSDTRMLACPDCGCTAFSWVIQQVQYGTVYRTENSKYLEEMTANGDVVGSDVKENGVFCQECEELYDRDELILNDE